MIDAMSNEKLDKNSLRWRKFEQFLQTQEYIMNADVRDLCGMSATTVNRILTNLVEMGNLINIYIGDHWQCQLK